MTHCFTWHLEREENVKADIFHAYIALLRQTKPLVAASAREETSRFGTYTELNTLLAQQVPLVMKATSKQMKVMPASLSNRSFKSMSHQFCRPIFQLVDALTVFNSMVIHLASDYAYL